MARIKQGFLGNASGKLGNVVFSKWRDLQTARQYQPDVHDANTPAQQKQRSRMVSLLQFLKPLNKNFIRLFNDQVAKGSTPWAKAIKDNMDAVAPDGCIIPANFRLGNPKYPPLEIGDVIYNPFIDQVSLKYRVPSYPFQDNDFPYLITSVLGKYKSDSGLHEFDTRHDLCMLPPGHFFCSFYDDSHEHVFDNWWGHGWLWFMYFDTYDIERIVNPGRTLSDPRTFTPKSMIEGFNTDVKDNPVPLEAFTTEFVQKEGKWFLVFKIDIKKTTLQNPENFTILFWGVALTDGGSQQSETMEWNLKNTTKEIELGEGGFHGSILGLYSLVTSEGQQVGRFNRFYISKDTEGIEHPYFDQIFDCVYAHPASFILSGNQCGFCGNIDELFGELIDLWEQGYIDGGDTPEPVVETKLKVVDDPNGKVTVTGFIRKVTDEYVFDSKAKASLETSASPGYKFSKWAGPDALDVKVVVPDKYELEMSKDRSITAVFVVIP
jgi:hypothetical protein